LLHHSQKRAFFLISFVQAKNDAHWRSHRTPFQMPCFGADTFCHSKKRIKVDRIYKASILSSHLIRMNERKKTVERRLLLGALVCAVLMIVGYFVLVSTAWGHKFDDDAFFGRETLSWKIIRLDSDILDLVRKKTLLLAAVVTLVIAAVRRCTFVGVVAVAAFGSAVVGAEVLKKVLPWRALVPKDALLDSGFRRNTYPSGHATAATSLTLGLLLVSPCRWRSWLAVAGGCISATFATGVMFAGWHRPSDALGALAWSGLCMSVAAAFVVRLRGRPRPSFAHPCHAPFGAVILGILLAAAAATWLISAAAPPEYQLADLPFFVLTGFIITGAFTLIAWYGWQLRAVDWPANRIS
jgi:membrane-associated phospholipid phosphatase